MLPDTPIAMEAPQQNLISKVSIIAKKELELRALIAEVDTLYNGDPNWDALITQEAIDSVPSFAAAGLTVQRIADVIYSSKVADQAIGGNMASMFVLANLP